MNKKLLIGILSAALLAGGATVALGADDTSELKDLYTQMYNLQKQIVDKQSSSGIISEDQAKAMKEAIDQKSQDPALDQGLFSGPCGGGVASGNGISNGCGSSGCGFNSASPSAATNF